MVFQNPPRKKKNGFAPTAQGMHGISMKEVSIDQQEETHEMPQDARIISNCRHTGLPT
jgi:hypothetical protein